MPLEKKFDLEPALLEYLELVDGVDSKNRKEFSENYLSKWQDKEGKDYRTKLESHINSYELLTKLKRTMKK